MTSRHRQARWLGSVRTRARARAIAVACCAAFAAPIAAAQETAAPEAEEPQQQQGQQQSSGIEEIVVRGAESDSSRDFASADSVTGFGAEDLAALGAQDIADIASFTPNLEIVTSGSTTPTFFIRGVGLNDFNANSTGAVAIYQDDVPINAPALQLATLYDIEGVNVLRGPQGTGLARNASAGQIKIYSRKPTGDYGGYLRSDWGNYDAQVYEGAVQAPIYQDLLAARFAFWYTDRDGTMKNRCGNAPPFADRVPVPVQALGPNDPPGTPNLVGLGLQNTSPPWSICGEPIAPFEGTPTNPTRVSDIPEGLASRVNDRHNWSARGTLLFQPTLDMSWLFNLHGSRRDERTRLGQAYGTRGFFCEDGDIANCGYIGQPSSAARVNNVLGGLQGTGTTSGYQAIEVKQMLQKRAPCFIGTPGFPGSTKCEQAANRASANAAKINVAQTLRSDLDTKPWIGDFNRTGPTTNDTYGSYLKGDIVLPGGLQLVSTSGYDNYDRKIDLDLDFSPETLFHILTKDKGWQATSDLKLQGQVDDAATLRWDVGGWFLREQLDVDIANDLGSAASFGAGRRDYTQDLYSAAGYVSVSYDFWDDFTLDGGARYNWEQKKLDYELTFGSLPNPFPAKLDETWTAPTGTVRLTYRFREDTHVYWKYTRGWKPGTYNATSALREDFSNPGQVAPDISVAKPETIDAFETGVRGSWLDGRLGLDVQFFYYAYKDYQLFTAQQFAGGQPEFVILNADNAEVYGAEVDLTGRPWPGAYLNVRFGWLESQYLDFVQLQQVYVNPPGQLRVTVNREINNTGNQLLNSPQFKVSLTAEQSVPLGRWGDVTARYDGVWTDTSYYDATEGQGIPNNQNITFLPNDTTAQRPYWVHNIRVSWRPPTGHIEIAGWVRNIGNKAYKTFAFDGSTFNNTTIQFVGDPRTYGGSLVVTF